MTAESAHALPTLNLMSQRIWYKTQKYFYLVVLLDIKSKKVNKTALSEIINVYNSPRRQKTVKKLLTEKNNNNCRMIP